MRLRVETSELSYTSANLRALGHAARDVAAALRRTAATALDADLDGGLRQVAGVGADAFELIAVDLEVVAQALIAGGATYRQVETAAVAAAGGSVRP